MFCYFRANGSSLSDHNSKKREDSTWKASRMFCIGRENALEVFLQPFFAVFCSLDMDNVSARRQMFMWDERCEFNPKLTKWFKNNSIPKNVMNMNMVPTLRCLPCDYSSVLRLEETKYIDSTDLNDCFSINNLLHWPARLPKHECMVYAQTANAEHPELNHAYK